MTRIQILMTKEGISGFVAKGHTGYSEHGTDIVCAAVSALTQTAVLGLQEVLGIPVDIEIDTEKGYLKCMLPEELTSVLWQQSQVVLQVMHHGLKAIMQEYGNKYVRIEEVELCGSISNCLLRKKV